jgi:DNA cross-link repair 1A protein
MRNLTVYLDTTYCDPNYDFPHQDAVINAVVDCVREENKLPGEALYVFGAYAIGKERVFMAVAQELNAKVFVDTTRWKSMCCYDWSMEEKSRLTTDPNQSNIWVVGMNQINFNHLQSLKMKKRTCNRVIAFQPTGWTFTNKSGSGNQPISPEILTVLKKYPFVHIRKKEGNTIFALPYSEHSSFSEMIQFLRVFKPGRVVPTVNTQKEKVEEQLKLLKEKSGIYHSNGENNQQKGNEEFSSGFERKEQQLVAVTTAQYHHQQQQQGNSVTSSFEGLFSTESSNHPSIFF